MRTAIRTSIAVLFTATSLLPAFSAQVVPPDEYLGHAVGADYELARWDEIVEYFQSVADASPRVNVRELGRTTEDRPLIMAEISSPDTMADLDSHKHNQSMIADPRKIEDEATEKILVQDSKVVVLVNCNLHSTEIGSSQMAMELLYNLAASDSPEMEEIRHGTIILLIPSANPDGLEKVIDWYERSRDKPWEGSGMPWLYHTYAGHDNNRDWFMLALKETRLITELLYHEWYPTIVYDVHQMGNQSIRFFLPPFHDPRNANVDPLIDQSLLLIGGHMAAGLAREEKKGVMHGALYDNWWSGGFRTTPYRHNMVGILTEAASPLIATPVFQRKSELRGAGRGMDSYAMTTRFPDPWPGGWWRLRDVVDYELIACDSLFTLAARYHDMFQSNYIRIGRKAIAQGKEKPPFAWIVPPDQRDPGTAARMIDILHRAGVEIHRARESFVADGITYPPQTYIMFCEQPYQPHLNDMMERQEYPERTEDGSPEPPYDIAGWTLPLQMGIQYVEATRPFDCNAELLEEIDYPNATIAGPNQPGYYIVPVGRIDDYRLLNRLHKSRIPVRVLGVDDLEELDIDAAAFPPGSFLIDDVAAFQSQAMDLTQGLSSTIYGFKQKANRESLPGMILPPVSLGVYQPWTASTDEGWTRLVLEDFEFPYTSIHNSDIRAGRLFRRFNTILIPSIGTGTILEGRPVDTTAPEYTGGIGEQGVVALQDFVSEGGTLICIDQSCNLPIQHFNIPVRNVLRGKSSSDFYCPGSLLRVAVDTDHPIGYGLPPWVSAYFTRSQAFEVDTAGTKNGDPRDPARRFPARVLARYADTVLLQSGWIRGAGLIEDQPAIVEVQYGEGRIILLGFRVQHRAQPHGTFRLLFNSIYRSAMAGEE